MRKKDGMFSIFSSRLFMVVFAMFLSLLVGMVISILGNKSVSYAASVEIKEIDYDAQTLTLNSKAGDHLLYFSDSKQKKWELAYGTWSSSSDGGSDFTMDISFVSPKKNYVLALKGDVSSIPIQVKLPAQRTNFTASLRLDADGSRVTTANANGADVEWRKKVTGYNSTAWNTYSETEFKKEFETLALKGATLYFRSAQKKGNGSDVGARPSKEVKVTISKRAGAPSVTLDGANLQIKGKTTMEWTKGDGTWNPFTTANLNLSDIAGEVLLTDRNEATSASIDVRTKQTSTRVASQAKTIKVPAQKETPNNFEFSFISQTKCGLALTAVDKKESGSVSIPAPSSSNAYEYTIVKPGSKFDLSEAKWTSITGTSQISITSTNAPEGSDIYYRKKAVSTKDETALATHPRKISIGAYPAAASVSSVTLKKIQGMDTSLTFSLRTPADNKVSSVTFNGAGTEFTTTVVKDAKPTDGVTYQTITVTLNSVAKVEAVSSNIGKELVANITLSSGETLSSGVSLMIIPKTVLASDSCSKLFSWHGVDAQDYDIHCEREFKLYTESVSDVSEVAPKIEKITIGGYALQSSEYKVEGSNGYQTVTITDAGAAKLGERLKLNTDYDVNIKLDNGEKLSGLVNYTVKSVASVTSSSSGFGFASNTYKEYNAASGTGIKNPVVTVTVSEEADKFIDGLHFDSVMWGKKPQTNGALNQEISNEWIDILEGLETSKLTTTITLNLKKVKESDLRGSYPVYFIYRDGNGKEYVIDRGYTLTCSK